MPAFSVVLFIAFLAPNFMTAKMGFVLIIQLTTFDMSLSPAGVEVAVYVVLHLHQAKQRRLRALLDDYYAVGD